MTDEILCEYEDCNERALHMAMLGVERIYLCEVHYNLFEFIRRISKANPAIGTRRHGRLSGPKNRAEENETKTSD